MTESNKYKALSSNGPPPSNELELDDGAGTYGKIHRTGNAADVNLSGQTGSIDTADEAHDLQGNQNFTLAAAAEQAINPASNGVAADRCLMTIHNDGANAIHINAATGGTNGGLKLAPGDVYETPRAVTSADAAMYVYSASGSDVRVTFWATS